MAAVIRWADRHPWITSIAVVVAVAVPGFFRVERIAQNAKNAVEADCYVRNAGRAAAQETWASLFDTLDDLLGPDDQAAVDQLRAGVVLLEPVDCDGDGDVDHNDIDSTPPTVNPGE